MKKSHPILFRTKGEIFRFIQATQKGARAVKVACALYSVSRSGYYAWCKRAPSARARAGEALLEKIRAVHAASETRYGSPRVFEELKAKGHRVGKK